MKTIRLPVISLAGAMLALIVYGSAYTRYSHAAIAQTAAAGMPSARPIIRAEVNDTIVDGSPGSSCWPQADGSPQCDFIEEPLPTSTVDITEGDTIRFTLDPAAPAPAELWATLPNDRNADGDPQRFDLLKSNGELMLEGLAEGPHLVEVQAVYTGDLAGNRPFVTYGFLVNIGTSVAASTATDEATPEATIEATTEATTEATVEATIEATIEATEETATPEAETPEATPEQTETPTEEATLEPTVEQPTPIATGGAVVIPFTPAATETLEPTFEATFEPTTVATAVPTTPLPPTLETLAATTEATLAATAETTSAATPGGITPSTGASVAPELAIIVAGRSYEPIAVSACVLSQDGTQTCVNRPRNANADRVLAAPGDVAQIRFEGPRPTTIGVTIASADGVTVINRQDLPPDNLVLYTLPTAPGNYVLSVEFAWPLGRATYYFRLVVGS